MHRRALTGEQPSTSRSAPRTFGVLCVAVCLLSSPRLPASARDVPDRLSDKAFWTLVTSSSEPSGTFPSDNFVSNESAYQTVIPRLVQTVGTGGVYLGVGPDQNFTYIAALRPRLAFIVDIRRQNMLLHLMYKAIFELAPTRAEFLSTLFCRPIPRDADRTSSTSTILDAISDEPPDSALSTRHQAAIRDRLTRVHKFGLTPSDLETIGAVYRVFCGQGPRMTYQTYPMTPAQILQYRMVFPSFSDLLVETDDDGVNRGYLANDAQYAVVREMERRNAIVPLVGDFAGPTAIRAVGQYVQEHNGRVKTVYTSNVEQYLFASEVSDRFYDNVSALPLDARSVFVRSYFPSSAPAYFKTTPIGVPDRLPAFPPDAHAMGLPLPTVSLLSPVRDTVSATKDGRVKTYFDLVELSK